jgi:hypothetical protein
MEASMNKLARDFFLYRDLGIADAPVTPWE